MTEKQYQDINASGHKLEDDSVIVLDNSNLRMVLGSMGEYIQKVPIESRMVFCIKSNDEKVLEDTLFVYGHKGKITISEDEAFMNHIKKGYTSDVSSEDDILMDWYARADKEGVFAIANNETVENIYAKIMNDNAKTKKDSNKLLIRDRYASWGGHKLTAINIPSDLWPQPLTEMEEELLKSQIVELVRRASSQTRSPFGHCKIPDAILKIGARSYLNWKKLLRDYMETDRSDETSYATPERKYLHMDLILPGHDMSEEVVEEVWAFVDSSGSIGQEDINSFLTELYHIIKQFQCVMNVCYWDTAVGDVYRGIRSQKELMNCLPHHSGGTNINCVYEWIKANKVKPSVMLILTDGMYGRVTSENYMPSLRRKTILVISNKDYVREDMKELGKIASF